jgi:hypothetical protein
MYSLAPPTFVNKIMLCRMTTPLHDDAHAMIACWCVMYLLVRFCLWQVCMAESRQLWSLRLTRHLGASGSSTRVSARHLIPGKRCGIAISYNHDPFWTRSCIIKHVFWLVAQCSLFLAPVHAANMRVACHTGPCRVLFCFRPALWVLWAGRTFADEFRKLQCVLGTPLGWRV